MRFWDHNIKMNVTENGFVFTLNFPKEKWTKQYSEKTNQVLLKNKII
jgi:hypothetical protein